MKKCALFILFLISITYIDAQDNYPFKPFRTVVSLGVTSSFKGAGYPGVLFSVEPNYRISNKIDAGILFQAATVPYKYDDYIDETDADNIHLVADYHFNPTKIDPYAGIGFGFANFNERSRFLIADNLSVLTRAGFSYKHLNVAAEYFFTRDHFFNYLDIKVGVSIGGGRRK